MPSDEFDKIGTMQNHRELWHRMNAVLESENTSETAKALLRDIKDAFRQMQEAHNRAFRRATAAENVSADLRSAHCVRNQNALVYSRLCNCIEVVHARKERLLSATAKIRSLEGQIRSMKQRAAIDKAESTPA